MKSTLAVRVVAFAVLSLPLGAEVGAVRPQPPRLERNGYTDIVVRLPHGLAPTDPGELFGQLERLLRRASGKLLQASDGLWYFKSVRVLVPPEMDTPRNLLLQDATWELFHDAHILLTKSGSKCKARQSMGCGVRGDFVALPLTALDPSADIDAAASSVVRSWAQFRYGVFEETAFGVKPQWCFYDGSSWRPTGCYTTNVTARPQKSADGILECLKKDVSVKQIFHSASEPASSLMFTSSIPKVQKFCDDRGNHSHLRWAPTKHNRLCKARSVWDVIRDSPDYSPSAPRLSFQPATLFDYVKPRTHRYFYVVQACAPDLRNQSYSKIMASTNEGLRRFLYAAPRATRWNLVLLDGDNVTASNEPDFDSNNITWQARWQYLRELDRNIKYTCEDPGVENTFKSILKVAQNEATTVVALLHSASVTPAAIGTLAAADTVRLVLILFDTGTPPDSAWTSTALRDSQLFVVPTAASQETMASLVDLALHTAHHTTADLDGDVVKVFQRTDVLLQDGVKGAFNFKSFESNVLSFIVACPDVYSIEESDVKFNGTVVPSHRVKMSMFATEQQLSEDPDIVSVPYALRARKSSQRCSFMASIRGSVQEPRVRLRGWLRRKKVDVPFMVPQVIYAELLYGEQPVRGAHVEAHVYHVAQNALTSTVVQLRDNGLLEPDMSKGDGVYSGYFLAASRQGGWYSVLVTATGNQALPARSNGSSASSFQRTEFAGSFWSSAAQGSMRFPPGTVSDLSASSVELLNVTFEWTAPGSEYDTGDGAGSSYELRYSQDRRLLSENFGTLPGLKFEQQKQPGDRDWAIVQLPEIKDEHAAVYFFALRTKSKEHRYSDISNVVTVFFGGLSSTSGDENVVSNHTSMSTDENSTDSLMGGPNSTAGPLLKTTLDDHETSSSLLYFNHFTEEQFYYVVAGAAGGFILFVLLINCLVCLICLRSRKSKDKRRNTDCVVIENAVGSDKPINAYEEQSKFDTSGNVGALRQKLSNLSQRRDGVNNATSGDSAMRSKDSADTASKVARPLAKASEREEPIALKPLEEQAPSSSTPSALPRSVARDKPRSIRTVVSESRANNSSEKAAAPYGPEPLIQRRPSGSLRSSKRSNASSSRTTRHSDRSRRTEGSRAPSLVDHARKRSGDYYDLGVV